ncbi:hypothetical protein MBLNU230_g0036t1 [Neophaeotheca triangularis]
MACSTLSNDGASSIINDRPKKLQRVSKACDKCNSRSIRCRPSLENASAQCQNCYDFGIECTYHRPSRRQRHDSNSQSSVSTGFQNPASNSQTSRGNSSQKLGSRPSVSVSNAETDDRDVTGAYIKVREGRSGDKLEIAWRSFALASYDAIEHLMNVYMTVAYPIYPLFHEPTLWRKLKSNEHLTDKGFFASIMAACALASARARDGALGDAKATRGKTPDAHSEVFFATAQDIIGKEFSQVQGFDYMRACALLAVTSIQYSNKKLVHEYLGHYYTLVAMQGFHNEALWPGDCDEIEVEERRRLFWSMYCFDVYTSVVFDSMLKSSETSAHVRYPREAKDDELTTKHASPPNEVVWLQGWNFTVDLYRILEYTIRRLRRGTQLRNGRMSITDILVRDAVPESQIMDCALACFARLPPRFKNYTEPPTGDRAQDIFGFQAANIQTTLQLLRVTHFSMCPLPAVYQKCDVAGQVLRTFHAVHLFYLQAISTSLSYHLGGVGHILSSIMEGPICEESYGSIRTLLVSMAELLKLLERGLQPTVGASTSLRSQIDRIDEYVAQQRRRVDSLAPKQNYPNNKSHAPVIMGPNAPLPPNLIPGAPESYASQQSQFSPNDAMPIPLQQPSMGVVSAQDEFHLPSDLVNDWPWPFNFTQDYAVGGEGGAMPGSGSW